MLCLDTYALMEIKQANPKFIHLLNEEFVITDMTMAEFYIVLYKEKDEHEAEKWLNKLEMYCKPVNIRILIKALKYRIDNKKNNLSIFDSVGYIFSLENNLTFVTGDQEFKNKKGVLFIKK